MTFTTYCRGGFRLNCDRALQGGHFGGQVEKSLDRSRSKFMVALLVGLEIIASFTSPLPLRSTGIRKGTWLVRFD